MAAASSYAPDRDACLSSKLSTTLPEGVSMNQSQLYRSVARATGETVDVIRHIGFTMLTPIVTEADAAGRWLQRAQQQRSFKRGRRQHIRSRQVCVAG